MSNETDTTLTRTRTSGVLRRPYLKGRNAAYLWSFVGVNLAIFLSLFVSKGFSTSSVEHLWKGVTAKDGIIATCIPLLTIVLTGLFSDVTKARLVFWRWRDPLPGCRAFTELMSTDPRIDVPALRKKHGEFPQDPKAQNALWYRLYKTHDATVQVSEAHRIYLLTRDMAGLAGSFAVLFSIGIIMDSVSWKLGSLYSAALVAQYLIIATSARNYGIRFVLNVLTEESHSTRGLRGKAGGANPANTSPPKRPGN